MRDLSVTLTSMTLSSYGTDLRRWVPDRDPHTSLAVFPPLLFRLVEISFLFLVSLALNAIQPLFDFSP
jgi:hypothetical protein